MWSRYIKNEIYNYILLIGMDVFPCFEQFHSLRLNLPKQRFSNTYFCFNEGHLATNISNNDYNVKHKDSIIECKAQYLWPGGHGFQPNTNYFCDIWHFTYSFLVSVSSITFWEDWARQSLGPLPALSLCEFTYMKLV